MCETSTLSAVHRGGRNCKGHFARSQMGYPEQAFCYFDAPRESLFLSRALLTLSICMGWGSRPSLSP